MSSGIQMLHEEMHFVSFTFSIYAKHLHFFTISKFTDVAAVTQFVLAHAFIRLCATAVIITQNHPI